MLRLFWIALGIISGGFAAYIAYDEPERFGQIVDLAATVISILISVSLALMAFLSAPFTVNSAFSKDQEERRRVERTIANDDGDFFDGQLVLFALFFVALGALLVLKWNTSMPSDVFESTLVRCLSGLAAFTSTLSFFGLRYFRVCFGIWPDKEEILDRMLYTDGCTGGVQGVYT